MIERFHIQHPRILGITRQRINIILDAQIVFGNLHRISKLYSIAEGIMLSILKIDTTSKAQVKRFIKIPYQLYKKDPIWVPQLWVDMQEQLNRQKFPFYEHSDADFFIAVKNGQDVGRLAVIENRLYNQYHHTQEANFYFFECIDDQRVANALFEQAFEWALQRGLTTIVGPRGMSPVDGYGMLIDSFDQPQMMAMMLHNPPYYVNLVENLGFIKKVEYLSCYAKPHQLHFPERIHRIAERVQQRGTLRVQHFNSTRELKSWVGRIGRAYNQSFVNNWEYYPLTAREIAYVEKMLLTLADPALIKIIVDGERVVGFLPSHHLDRRAVLDLLQCVVQLLGVGLVKALLLRQSIRGIEKKPLPHMLCVTNMLLHGVDDASFVRHDNTLATPYLCRPKDHGARTPVTFEEVYRQFRRPVWRLARRLGGPVAGR